MVVMASSVWLPAWCPSAAACTAVLACWPAWWTLEATCWMEAENCVTAAARRSVLWRCCSAFRAIWLVVAAICSAPADSSMEPLAVRAEASERPCQMVLSWARNSLKALATRPSSSSLWMGRSARRSPRTRPCSMARHISSAGRATLREMTMDSQMPRPRAIAPRASSSQSARSEALIAARLWVLAVCSFRAESFSRPASQALMALRPSPKISRTASSFRPWSTRLTNSSWIRLAASRSGRSVFRTARVSRSSGLVRAATCFSASS